MSKEVKIAIISALSTVVAAIISGIFLLYINQSAAKSAGSATPAKNVSSSTATGTTVPASSQSNLALVPTPTTQSLVAGGKTSPVTPTAASAPALLQASPSTANLSSCLSTDQRRIVFNITNTSANQLSWSLQAGSSYTYSLLDHTGNQITTSVLASSQNVPIASKQTQAVLVSNIQGSGTIVLKSPQSASQTITISCATTTPPLAVSPQSVTFDTCSSLNSRAFAFSVINNSSQALSWQLSSQAPQGSVAFATEDASQPGGQIQGKHTAIVLVNNIQGNMALEVSGDNSTNSILNVTCG